VDYAAHLKEIAGFFRPLPDKPEETAEGVLRALWLCAAGRPMSIAAMTGEDLPPLSPVQAAALEALIQRKREGVPLAHLTGRQNFLGLELLASPDALIPRKETEILGRAALAHLDSLSTDEIVVIDVCTGSGNLALAYAHRKARAKVYGVDLSDASVALARRNAEFTGLAGRVEFHAGDLFEPLEGMGLEERADLVSCNPPYISSAKVAKMDEEISAHEPSLAFDGGAMGLAILTRLFNEAPRFIRPGGALCFELGLGQGPMLEKRLRRQPWVAGVEAHHDESGAIRALLATKR
jgi:release factor glutamine methyltransferase